jgi:hypothetical protein
MVINSILTQLLENLKISLNKPINFEIGFCCHSYYYSSILFKHIFFNIFVLWIEKMSLKT